VIKYALLVLMGSYLTVASLSAMALASEGEPELLQLYQYKPIYFIVGNPYTKVQLSLKTQIVRQVPIYFAYDQLFFWDIFNHSPYIQDINYNPLVFYRYMISDSRYEWIDLIPEEHESNGRGGPDERSWNRFGATFHLSIPAPENAPRVYWNLIAWVPFQTNLYTQDVAQYRGVWEFEVTLANFLGRAFEFDDLNLRFYPGGESYTNPLHGGQELTFRSKLAYRNFLPLFVAQLFHGYGESLSYYQDDRWGFRAGIGF
jgi:outer membrane phospholipase A